MSDFVKEIDGFPGYFVTRDGRVYSAKRSHRTTSGFAPWWKQLQPWADADGYVRVEIGSGGNRKRYLLHVLVAAAFCQKPDGTIEVNHRDGCKQNNNASNLEWTTRRGNMVHASAKGLMRHLRGSENKSAKLTESQVREIKAAFLNPRRGLAVALAKSYGVTEQAIYSIKYGKNWKHVHCVNPSAGRWA